MNPQPFANCAAHSSHGGAYASTHPSGVLAEGFPPLCAGDLHHCPLCLPGGSPHPPLALLPSPPCDILVAGRPWVSQGTVHPCVGPAQVSVGCRTLMRRSSEDVIPEDSPHAKSPERFRYSC